MIIMRPAPGNENYQPRNAQSKTQRSRCVNTRRSAAETGVSGEGRKAMELKCHERQRSDFKRGNRTAFFFSSVNKAKVILRVREQRSTLE